MVGLELDEEEEGYGKNQRGHQKIFLCAHLLRCMRKVTKQQSRIYGGGGAGGAQKGKTDLRHSLRGAVWSWLWLCWLATPAGKRCTIRISLFNSKFIKLFTGKDGIFGVSVPPE